MGVKYLLGRVLIWHIHQNNIIDDEIYVCRVGKAEAEVLVSLQLIADYARMWKINMAALFNNVDGCFDRIPPKLAKLAVIRIGCPTIIAKTHTKVQQKWNNL